MKLKISGLILLYFFVFALIYGVLIINPFYTDWCLIRNPRLDVDIPINFLNGLAFFNSDAPIPFTDNNDYPNTIGVLYADCIPIFAVILKLILNIFPHEGFVDFQYAGIWGVLNFILLGLLSFAFIKKFTKTSDLNATLCSLFFVTVPLFLDRFPRTYACSSVWLILLSFLPFVFREKFSKNSALFFYFLLGLFSAGVHSFFVPSLFLNLCALIVYDYFKSKNSLFSVKTAVVYVLGVFLTFFALGGFCNMEQTAGGYRFFVFNWASFVSPGYAAYGMKSVVFPILNYFPDVYGGCNEGFAYLGAGIIILVFGIFFYLAKMLPEKKQQEKYCEFLKKYNYETILFSGLFIVILIFASGAKFDFYDYALFERKIPFFENFYSFFVTAGMFIRTNVFIIYFAVLCFILKTCNKKVATAVIGVCLCIQLIDFSELFYNLHIDYALKKEFVSPLKNVDAWQILAKNKKTCIIYDKDRLHTPATYPIYYWGLQNGLKHNQMVYSRFGKNENDFVFDKWINPSDDDLFVFLKSQKDDIKKYSSLENCYLLDDYIVCTKENHSDLNKYKLSNKMEIKQGR